MKEKQLTVSSKSAQRKNYRPFSGQSLFYPSHSWIQLQGRWLEDLGFHIGDKIKVSYEQNRIILEPIKQSQPTETTD